MNNLTPLGFKHYVNIFNKLDRSNRNDFSIILFMKYEILTNYDDLSRASSIFFINQLRNALKFKQEFIVALSGGPTPLGMFRYLTDHFGNESFWKHVHFF